MTQEIQRVSPFFADPAPAHSLIDDTDGRFRVHARAYTDQAIFDLEQKQVFSRVWVYVGHESEFGKPGDFKTTHIGLQPVIVSRGEDKQIHVMLNRCMHRGAAVCRELHGNTQSFICPYHAWKYSVAGRLLAISGEKDPSGYSAKFDKPEGLRKVPRVDHYRGFYFASLNPDVVPLVDYLGPAARQLIDRKLAQAPEGRITVQGRPFVGVYQGNWKFQSENIIDGYHFMYTHRSFVQLQAKYGDTTGDFGVHKGGSAAEMSKYRNQGNVTGGVHGHGINQKPVVGYDDFFTGAYKDHFSALRDRYGDEELRWVLGMGAGCLFPTFGMIHNQIRIWRPIGPAMTEVTIYPYSLDGAPADFNEGMLRSHERFYGPAGYGAVDDVEVFAINQQGLSASDDAWLIMERGMEAEKRLDSGEVEGLPSSETVHRAFWRQWRRLMDGR